MARISDVIEGLTILSKYIQDGPLAVDAEGDSIYSDHGPTPNEIAAEEIERLKQIGWEYDAYNERWGLLV